MSVETKTDVAARMMALFEGYAEAYGTYDKANFSEQKGKLEIKSTARTLRKPVTKELWEQHLKGEQPLGIIPIRANNTCLWGVIDIDQYGISHAEVVEKVTKEDLPLVVCRSKSGGAHAFLFLKDPIESATLISKLGELSAMLGYGGSEIFPKQQLVYTERGDLGNWLNMPYFEMENTARFGIKANGLEMTIHEFLRHAEESRVDESFFSKKHRKTSDKSDPVFGDGPPCMQHLTSVGFPEGVRNKGLFALGVFAKRKFGEKWVQTLEDWNYRYFDPPLNSREVADVIKSLEKKEYNYSCRAQPLSAHCNSVLCRARRFGVGGSDDYPVISGLSVLETDPPIFFVDVDDTRLELSTDELLNYNAFQRVCVERLLKYYRTMKKETWGSIVAQQLTNVVRIEAPPEVGRVGHFMELMEKFLTDKHKAETQEELLLGKPYYNPDDDCYYFRMQDLQKYLETEGFKIFNRGQLSVRIRNGEGGHKFLNLKGKGVNVWFIPAGKMKITPQPDLPGIERSPI